MQKVTINLASKTVRSPAPYAVVAAVLLLSLAISHLNWSEYLHDRARYLKDRQVAQSFNRSAPVDGSIDLKRIKSEVELANRVASRRGFSWTYLLTALEESMPQGVFLLQISPDFEKKRITLVGAGGSVNHALEMIDKMNESEYFYGALMLKHDEDGVKKILKSSSGLTLFSVSASYRAGVAR